MGCFPCFDSKEEETLNPQKQPNDRKDSHPTLPTNISRLSSGADRFKSRSNVGAKREQPGIKELADAQIAAQTFTFRELAAATNNFRPESFIGEGGFRRVYKGRLQTTGQRSKAQLEMGCFPCFGSKVEEDSHPTLPINTSGLSSDKVKSRSNVSVKKEHAGIKEPSYAQTFTFRELVAATNNFRPESLLGEGGFGRVYKGMLESTNQVVAVKQLNRNGLQGNREFLVEVLMLSQLHNSNIVNLIGYCADGDQRLLVYEFMPLGSLEDHLHDLPPDKEPLDWNTRMKIAAGAAKGLEFLHDKANPPVIYRDFKSSNILLGEGFHPKLSDLGLAKLGPVGDKSHISARVAGTYGYLAPDYAKTGQLTVQSDVYSFGVVLLELITGRKALDITRPQGQQYLVTWARSLFIDHRKFAKLADPRLQGQYPMRGLYQAVAVASMCIQEQSADRPLIHNVVAAISNLANHAYELSSALGHGYRLTGDRDDKMTEVVEDS